MPGTDPNTQDDDDGEFGDFLAYKLWKAGPIWIRGYMILALAFVAGLIARSVLY